MVDGLSTSAIDSAHAEYDGLAVRFHELIGDLDERSAQVLAAHFIGRLHRFKTISRIQNARPEDLYGRRQNSGDLHRRRGRRLEKHLDLSFACH